MFLVHAVLPKPFPLFLSCFWKGGLLTSLGRPLHPTPHKEKGIIMKTYSTSLLVVAFCSWSWSAANAQESEIPSDMPSLVPSGVPSSIPSDGPSLIPSTLPTASVSPTAVVSKAPTATPTVSSMPTEVGAPTMMPTKAPVDATNSETPTDSPEMGGPSTEAPTTPSGGVSPPTHAMFWIALSVAYAIGGPNFL
jgi:hypothetical protein